MEKRQHSRVSHQRRAPAIWGFVVERQNRPTLPDGQNGIDDNGWMDGFCAQPAGKVARRVLTIEWQPAARSVGPSGGLSGPEGWTMDEHATGNSLTPA